MSGKRIEVVILSDLCKGCGLCVEVCPQGKLSMDPKPNQRGIRVAAVDPELECTGCLQCAVICPDAAITITRHDESQADGAGQHTSTGRAGR